nr:2-amino-4-hydroxy-6-hydroxymethyldihydropteridine diphosphokinase [Deltaproteobacteria bacterium]
RWWRTPPMRGGTARGWFLNGVAVVRTELSPEDLLDRCIALERRAGRRRARYWGDRTLDLDLLHVEGVVSDGPRLVLPHPGIARRPFVVLPLREVWRDAVDPRTGRMWADSDGWEGPRPTPCGVLSWTGGRRAPAPIAE